MAFSTHRALNWNSPSKFFFWVSTSVSKRLMVLVLAACFSGPRHPTMTRMAGSWARHSASLVSS